MPVLLVMALALGIRHHVTEMTAKTALVMTFAGHGSFALGLWPTPANFYAMICLILRVEYETAQVILRTAGILDFVVCVGIFIPSTRRVCSLYAAVWGLLTALARPVAGMSWSLNYWGADQFLHETLLRAPHCLIPLYLFVLWREPLQVEEQAYRPFPLPQEDCKVAELVRVRCAMPLKYHRSLTTSATANGLHNPPALPPLSEKTQTNC